MAMKNQKKLTVVTKCTTDEERSKLRQAGYVHVTGLTTHFFGREKYIIGEKTKSDEFGKWDRYNEFEVLVTLGGEIWLGALVIDEDSMTGRRRKVLRRDLCPNGRGAFVPCTNGFQLYTLDLLQRMCDSSFGISYSS